jgi:carbamoyl-phosphate synthase large subunit
MGIDYTYEAALAKALIAAGLILPQEGSLLFSIADKDKKEALSIIKGFYKLGYQLYATEGTGKFLEENGMTVKMIGKKLNEGHPNVLDIINDGSVVGVLNTVTGGRVSLQDGFEIRRTATEKRIPCFTSLDTARVAWNALANGSPIYNIKPLKEYLDRQE